MKTNLIIRFLSVSLVVAAFGMNAQAEVSSDNFTEKQHKAIKLINAVGTIANSPRKSSVAKEDAEYAFNGFVARLQGIREHAQSAGSQPDTQNQQKMDRLIVDVQNYLR